MRVTAVVQVIAHQTIGMNVDQLSVLSIGHPASEWQAAAAVQQ